MGYKYNSNWSIKSASRRRRTQIRWRPEKLSAVRISDPVGGTFSGFVSPIGKDKQEKYFGAQIPDSGPFSRLYLFPT